MSPFIHATIFSEAFVHLTTLFCEDFCRTDRADGQIGSAESLWEHINCHWACGLGALFVCTINHSEILTTKESLCSWKCLLYKYCPFWFSSVLFSFLLYSHKTIAALAFPNWCNWHVECNSWLTLQWSKSSRRQGVQRGLPSSAKCGTKQLLCIFTWTEMFC